jgi:hypothetical protein
MKPLIYLASPHSHTEPLVRQMRYELALKALRILLNNGLHVFSPIVHSHDLNLSNDFAFCQEIDFHFLHRCDELWVLLIDGTWESIGVKAEIKEAEDTCKKVSNVWFGKLTEGVYVGRDGKVVYFE